MTPPSSSLVASQQGDDRAIDRLAGARDRARATLTVPRIKLPRRWLIPRSSRPSVDLELWTASGRRIGVIARERNLLPGRYAFGLTGRDPGGQKLKKGRYRLRIIAFPAGGGRATLRSLMFSIK